MVYKKWFEFEYKNEREAKGRKWKEEIESKDNS